MPRGTPKNGVRSITPITTSEKARELGRLGGVRSGEVRREKARQRKEMKSTLETLLTMSLKTGKAQSIDDIQAFAKIQNKNISVNEAIAVRVVQRALNGDLKAFELIRDTIGEKPADNLRIEDITPVIIKGEGDILE
ncbi:hypothetical protein [uncultured Phascolarctobacterium sp.]|uniref:hypothetical protein n=1 Tax=uncultured Phascolarctobacterium sp. TaxID=512296 RepID=UPI0027D97E74|nr:hypothetical protein [uncultured Phascolarctobacterium sp.]